MGRELYLHPNPEGKDYEEQQKVIESVSPGDNVSMKGHRVDSIAAVAEELGIDAIRFRELMGVPDEKTLEQASKDIVERLRNRREFVLSTDEVDDLCRFAHRTRSAIEDSIDVDAVREERRDVPRGQALEDHHDAFELKCFEAWGTMKRVEELCDIARSHDMKMRIG